LEIHNSDALRTVKLIEKWKTHNRRITVWIH
jgi:hypothetical protein